MPNVHWGREIAHLALWYYNPVPALPTMPNVHCSGGVTNGIVHNAKCAMSATPTVVGETQKTLFTMPNVQCLLPQL